MTLDGSHVPADLVLASYSPGRAVEPYPAEILDAVSLLQGSTQLSPWQQIKAS